MALQKYEYIGTNKLKCARPFDDICYNGSSGSVYYSNVYDIKAKTTIGTDVSEIIKKYAVNIPITLIKFKDNSEIFIKKTQDDAKQPWGTDTFFLWYHYIKMYYKNSLGASRELPARSQWFFGVESNGVKIEHPIYIFTGIDDELQRGYIGTIFQTRKSSNGFPTIPFDEVDSESEFKQSWDLGELTNLYNIFKDNGLFYDPDPWSVGGYADIGGGDGELDLTSDVITLPSVPTSFSETGFVQVFIPSLSQINELSGYLWSSNFFENFLKLFNDPMDILISLSMLPFPVQSSGSRLVYAGNVVTTVTMPFTSQQYVEIDCGSLFIKNFYNAYIDYDPYTTCEIFLPYIGYQKLSTDSIMGKTIKVKYRVDIITGICSAFILCNDILFYTFSGSCACSIPISSQSYNSIAQGVLSIATSTVLASKPTKTAKGIETSSARENGGKSALASASSNVMSLKPDVQRSGSVSSNVGMLGAQKPHLIITVPNVCLPKNQNKYLGLPSFMSVKLSSLTGFTVVENIRLENLTCTEPEKEEIMQLLKGGVII